MTFNHDIIVEPRTAPALRGPWVVHPNLIKQEIYAEERNKNATMQFTLQQICIKTTADVQQKRFTVKLEFIKKLS